ncbi:arsenate reductase (glutaredoxin) [Sedimentitalea sp.]|uniref:arsenate reductase (glutaredoxin) n=1 Tax=Sedimentitalea sp. TaxID=2048915 RepID=UPI003296807D
MIDIWHNPRCTKSRQAVALLSQSGATFRERRYLEDVPTLQELRHAHAALGRPPVIEMIRTDEKLFRELGLSNTDDEDALLQAMAEHPILIERPLAVSGRQAVIGRPPERILELL